MPTPSAPDPHAPYAFSSTCPETDDSSTSRDDTPVNSAPHSIRHSTSEEDESASRLTAVSSAARYDDTDGPVPDIDPDADMSSTVADSSSPCLESHKTPEVDLDRTDSPSEQSPVEHIRTLTPRHGVGTSHRSARHIDIDATYNPQYQLGHAMEYDYGLPSMGRGYPSGRVIPTSPSSFLRAGSRFTGTQQSERQVYDVQVEIKYVDLRESSLCGYLRIQGLTDDHPTLTTYFEGEIIGTKYGFMTKHDSWGANDKTDLSHWSKFPAFRPYSKQARRGSSVVIKDIAQSEYIFMRWKEHFLVPDHRVRTITGASFEGFYYICFNQVQGEVNGIYFHSKSERFQQLELKHVEDRGCLGALEFR